MPAIRLSVLEIGRERDEKARLAVEKAKLRWQHPDNRVGEPVHRELAVQDVRIAVELILPELVGNDHHLGIRVEHLFLGECSPHGERHAEGGEKLR